MRYLPTSHAIKIMLLVLGLSGLSRGVEQDQTKPSKELVELKSPDSVVMHTIEARVTFSAGANNLAEHQPGIFKVPTGQVARHFKYYFADPKTGIERDKLNNRTIYCETTKSWVEIPVDSATLELPPGDYKFVVGGTPGSSGTLSFQTESSAVAAAREESSDALRIPPAANTPTTPFRDDLLGFGFDYPKDWKAVGIERGTYRILGVDADPKDDLGVTIKIVAKTDAQDTAMKHLLNIHGRLVDKLQAESTKLGPTKVADEEAVFAIHSYVSTDSTGKQIPVDHVQSRHGT